MEYSLSYLFILLATVFLLYCYSGYIIAVFEIEARNDPFELALASIFLGVCASLFSALVIIGISRIPEAGLPETWKICFGLLIFMGIALGFRIEFTGNLLIDSFLIALVISPLCFLIANGVSVFFSQGFNIFSVNVLIVLSGVFSLLFRILFWIKGETG